MGIVTRKMIPFDPEPIVEYPENCPACGSSVFAEQPHVHLNADPLVFVADAAEGNAEYTTVPTSSESMANWSALRRRSAKL